MHTFSAGYASGARHYSSMRSLDADFCQLASYRPTPQQGANGPDLSQLDNETLQGRREHELQGLDGKRHVALVVISKKNKKNTLENFNFWFETKSKHSLVLPSFQDNVGNKTP